MKKPLLIMFIGFPGSGKTYFATHLSTKLKAVTLNSDALRVAMFGSLERIEEIRQSDQSRLYADVFNAMDYAARKALEAGHSVVYDAQQTKRVNRQGLEKLAHDVGATPVLVWMKTDPKVAIQRGVTREARADSHQYAPDKMNMLVERFARVTDMPVESENLIVIDGELPFDKQCDIFMSGVGDFI